ncbi:MAG: FecR family protein [Bacteroidales bacterium]|nr:FecR family protein [Bacteroidales bacterium]
MERKRLDKKLLSELFIGSPDPDTNKKALETEEVKSMMYAQWKEHADAKSQGPDFTRIFEKVKERTHPEKTEKSANTEFLIREIDFLKNDNKILKKRIRLFVSVAASIVLIISFIASVIMINSGVFETYYSENIAPAGQKSQVILPDGTMVYLNSGSAIRYSSFFNKKNRSINLSGEAYFEVTRNPEMPFIINTRDIEVEVVGTKFNVMAYPDDNYIETVVAEGKVSVTELHNKTNVLLNANQKATYYKDSRLLVFAGSDPKTYICWKDNILIFDNENFAQIIKKLERWYGVTIYVTGRDSLEDRFTMTIKDESLREVLELIGMTTDIEYTINDKDVKIHYN